jgi:peptidoglycan/xylan/chitin deacetylase (PgdA/CDA1 family)
MKSKLINRIISPFATALPIEKLIETTGQRFIFPFWHSVSDVSMPHLSQLYQVSSVSTFEHDLNFLLKNFHPATVEEVSGFAISGRQPSRKLFFASFDDGMAECYHVIAPILKKNGIQAAFFINPGFVDNKMLFHRLKASLLLNSLNKQNSSALKEAQRIIGEHVSGKNIQHFLRQASFSDHLLLDQLALVLGVDFATFLKQQQPYMSLQQIKELQEDGFLIGAHGLDHREFFLSSEDEMLQQIAASMEFLVKEIAPPMKSFAFPFTDFGVPDSVFTKAGNSKLWDISFGTAGLKNETLPKHLQRIPMEASWSNFGEKTIKTEYLWYCLKSKVGKSKVKRS